jgi:hypothetical protein
LPSRRRRAPIFCLRVASRIPCWRWPRPGKGSDHSVDPCERMASAWHLYKRPEIQVYLVAWLRICSCNQLLNHGHIFVTLSYVSLRTILAPGLQTSPVACWVSLMTVPGPSARELLAPHGIPGRRSRFSGGTTFLIAAARGRGEKTMGRWNRLRFTQRLLCRHGIRT